MEMVQEIHQLLMDREDTCHRTCFSLQLNGTTLDNFAELKNIEGLKEGSIIKVSLLTALNNISDTKNLIIQDLNRMLAIDLLTNPFNLGC